MKLRKTTEADIKTVLSIHKKAFGENKGPEIADLVDGLLHDQTAMPLLSLIAFDNSMAVGHSLYTKARLNHSTFGVTPKRSPRCSLTSRHVAAQFQ